MMSVGMRYLSRSGLRWFLPDYKSRVGPNRIEYGAENCGRGPFDFAQGRLSCGSRSGQAPEKLRAKSKYCKGRIRRGWSPTHSA